MRQHLQLLGAKLINYFPSFQVEDFDWVRNPFVSCQSKSLSCEEEDELIDVRNDTGLKLVYKEFTLEKLWIEVLQRHPNIGRKAVNILLPFSTSYLCETNFSKLTNIKSKMRERLLIVEEEMRVALSYIRPDIGKICASLQVHQSH